MPELPEVETVVRGLRPVLEGQRLARAEILRPDLRFPFPPGLAERLTGRRVGRVLRRAKYILVELDAPERPAGPDGREILLAHLGMSGRLYIDRARPNALLPHDHVVLTVEDGTTIRFNDARRFGMMDLVPEAGLASHRLLAALGPEPLSEDFDGSRLAAAFAGRRSPVKAVLLDQRVVAGLGNIYISEALFHAGISPHRLAASVGRKRADRLAAAIRDVLLRAIEAGGSSLRDYVRPSGELGYFQTQWAVYGREGAACPGCDCDPAATGGIRRVVQSNRSTFYCPRRQR